MEVVIILSCTLFGFLAVVFVIILACYYGDYRVYGCYDDMIEVPFSAFKQVYLAIPEQFSLDDWYYKNHNKFYKFRYFDAIRYRLFCHFEDKKKSKRNNVAGYKVFLENAQHDIEEKQKQIHEETIRDLQKIRDEVAKK